MACYEWTYFISVYTDSWSLILVFLHHFESEPSSMQYYEKFGVEFFHLITFVCVFSYVDFFGLAKILQNCS